jgi:hypothetical protein
MMQVIPELEHEKQYRKMQCTYFHEVETVLLWLHEMTNLPNWQVEIQQFSLVN